ncbi:glutamate synthase large subunit [Verrucomicrobiaceae bacterium 5K15]|uniref:Glutamate synthase [NADPH] large chain n=1 Tax=Oceaniferula flava TaxID=2800421 RepID=A0AAE2V8P2_9BACT|nr:glutamate synthase large subunit [Oceaniferula flavus]MBK1853843.1 glutamate synthase large subunit [Oceaniferula flavus]MBM1135149.1 glutamate synthase large subunit [Oceaniferula flavus]
MSFPYHNNTPDSTGSMHSFSTERDNCGMGAIANIHGKRSYQIVDLAIESVCNMTHRGAVDADMKTGDGSGILSQIPYPIFRKAAAEFGTELKDDTDLAVGVFFLPFDDQAAQEEIKQLTAKTIAARGISLIGWREAPVAPEELGKLAQKTRPQILHLLMEKPEGWDADHFERQLYLCRRSIERDTKTIENFYIPSFSSRLISYKGLAMPATLKAFYLDLQNPEFETAICLYHQRFSTNTFPAWPLGQPFRMMCHNGEINTVRGNRNWMASREEFFESEIWGEDVELLKNVLREDESDSASLDHALELLTLSGRSLEHSMCMLVPPAFRDDADISDDLRAFYQYHRSFAEPWDGPAGLVYTDGNKLCASLDRNGLRPSRFKLTEDGLLYIGSEIGAVQIDSSKVIRTGRLGPGQMLSADLSTGELKFDREIKEGLAKKAPYRRWIDENRLELHDFISPDPQTPAVEIDPVDLSRMQIMHAINTEELDMVFPPMIKGAQEAVFSMGDDIPLAVLSSYPRLLPTYFKQLFAQVTNPPIDPIRERSVMTLAAGLGAECNLLAETPEHARVLNLDSAILLEQEMHRIKDMEEHGFPNRVIDITWDASTGAAGMEDAVKRVCMEAEATVDENINVLILSDRAASAERVPLPAMLITGAVHHHLNRVRKRLRCSLVVECGEARDTHQIACLFGFGATAVCPYLGYATVRDIVRNDTKGKIGDGISESKAMSNYRKALEKGLLKIMSKMGISVLNSYQGAQIFEAIGIGKEVMDVCFTGAPSRLSGIGFKEIAEESIIRHKAAFADVLDDSEELDELRVLISKGKPLPLGDPGYYRYRKQGERHAITTEVIKNFHTYLKDGKQEDYDDYVKASLETHPVTIKDLFEFVPSSDGAVPLEEVEPRENIVRRFTTAAMSMGALSPEAHETLAIAMNRIGAKSDSGEGGEDPRRFQPYPNGDWARSRIKQIASGRFGVSAHYLVNADELEIKMAQGAKPGEGGQLPGHKVNGIIARLRNTQPGVQLISPPPHHDIYSIEDLAQLIHDLKEINPRAKVTVKLVAEAGVGTVAAGVAKADADVILISGHDGGTAASPLSSTKHAGLPWEMGLSEAQQTLVLNNLRSRVTLRTDGGMKNGRDIITAAILGAEEYNFGTMAMIAMGCVYVRRCHLNNCPVGVATTDPKWRAKFNGTPEMVVKYFYAVADEARKIMAGLGVKTLDELIGRPEFLRQREVPDHPKANSIDLSPVLKDIAPAVAKTLECDPKDVARICQQDRNDGIQKPALDLQIIEDVKSSIGSEDFADLMDRQPVNLEYKVVNTDRNLGTRLSGRIAEVHGNHGLPNGTINLTFRGSAGQSLGTFLCGGININAIGEANDYVGKGMAGGRIVVQPEDNVQFEPADNSLAGNTCMYGATGGELYINGRAGERFCVRNSGGTAVCEGVGDHGCEYMTNGLVLILGLTGKNFGAGMSGGTAFVYDKDGRFQSRINTEMVAPLPIRREQDIAEVKRLVEKHVELTGSARAQRILDNWEKSVKKFIRVIPKERAELEAAEESHEAASNVGR